MTGLFAEATIERLAQTKATVDILCQRVRALEMKAEQLEQEAVCPSKSSAKVEEVEAELTMEPPKTQWL